MDNHLRVSGKNFLTLSIAEGAQITKMKMPFYQVLIYRIGAVFQVKVILPGSDAGFLYQNEKSNHSNKDKSLLFGLVEPWLYQLKKEFLSGEKSINWMSGDELSFAQWVVTFFDPVELCPVLEKAIGVILSMRCKKVSEVAMQCNVSARYVDRLFKKVMKVTPKSFCQMVRFNQALGLLQSGEMGPLALTCGFFDQAHFSREIKKFSQHTPDELCHGQAFWKISNPFECFYSSSKELKFESESSWIPLWRLKSPN